MDGCDLRGERSATLRAVAGLGATQLAASTILNRIWWPFRFPPGTGPLRYWATEGGAWVAVADLALLACPVGMGAMMWMMMRGGHQSNEPSGPSRTDDQRAELARLRAELDQLQAAERDRESKPTP